MSVCPVLSVCPVCDIGLLWPNGWMHQDGTWHGGRPRPGYIVLDGDPKKKGRNPKFSAHVYCGQTAGWIKMVLGIVELGLGQATALASPAPPPQKRYTFPNFCPCLLSPNGWMDPERPTTLYEGRPRPKSCTLWDSTQRHPPKRGTASPNFRPRFIVAKQLDGSRSHLVRS